MKQLSWHTFKGTTEIAQGKETQWGHKVIIILNLGLLAAVSLTSFAAKAGNVVHATRVSGRNSSDQPALRQMPDQSSRENLAQTSFSLAIQNFRRIALASPNGETCLATAPLREQIEWSTTVCR